MITVKVTRMDENNKNEFNMKVLEESTISELLNNLNFNKKTGDYFFIVNGIFKQPNHILKEGDRIEIFPAMCGG